MGRRWVEMGRRRGRDGKKEKGGGDGSDEERVSAQMPEHFLQGQTPVPKSQSSI